jgi:hypothetical protein
VLGFVLSNGGLAQCPEMQLLKLEQHVITGSLWISLLIVCSEEVGRAHGQCGTIVLADMGPGSRLHCAQDKP